MTNPFLSKLTRRFGEFFNILRNIKICGLLPSALFFSFICWMIFMANLNRENLIMSIGHRVPSGDKIGHFMLFGLLALFLNSALKFRKVPVFKHKFYLGSMLVALFAIGEEFSQLFFENRTFDWVDLVFDFWGIHLLSSKVCFKYLYNIKHQLISKKKPLFNSRSNRKILN